MTKSKVIVAMMAVMMLGLTGTAYADSLEKEAEGIHKCSQGQLISLDGDFETTGVMVNLATGQGVFVSDASPVLVANRICDTATVKPAGANGRVIYCIAK